MDNSYLILLSVDCKSDPYYGKVAAKVINENWHEQLYFANFCKAFPKDEKSNPTWPNELEQQMLVLDRQGYELMSCKDHALLLFSDYLMRDIIETVGKYQSNTIISRDVCQIIIDCSFGDERVNETINFYKDAIGLIPKRAWMNNYFGEPILITAGINNKVKNHDPLLHCEKIISQAPSFR